MILLIGTYAISVILIPTSIIFNLDIINTRLIPDLLLLYLPLIGGICLHISLRFKSYYKLRAELSTLAQEGSELTTEHRVETVLSDKINVAATSADLLLRKPVIIINKSFAQNLNSSELRAIYYHELYHIKQKTDKIQNLPNIPLIGPLLFLTVISPREVYREEFKADQFAVEKEGRDAVIGALQKAKESGEVSEHRHVAQPNQQKMLPFLILLASVPILSLYRPSKMERIDKMRSIKPNRD
jgi:Zn-dependent protease with chaperone function